MTKTNKVKEYTTYDLSPDEVKKAIINYMYDEHNTVVAEGKIYIHDLDNSATVTMVWSDKEKAQS